MRNILILIFGLLSFSGSSQIAAMLMTEPEAAGATYLLDDYPADAAYSLRLLKANQIDSAAIRVRRSSDNAEQDIGFTSEGYLDTASMKTFVGANSGYVVTWYDQSGSENDATQATAASQPRIINAGTVDRHGGLPAVVFDGTNDNIDASYVSNSAHSFFIVSDVTNLEGDAILLNQNGSVGDVLVRKNAYAVRFFASDEDVDVVTTASAAGQSLVTCIWDGELPLTPFTLPPTGTLSSYQNGALVDDSASDANFTLSSVGLMIGWDNVVNTGSRYNKSIQEIIIYTSDQSANRTTIETEINTHYSIY